MVEIDVGQYPLNAEELVVDESIFHSIIFYHFKIKPQYSQKKERNLWVCTKNQNKFPMKIYVRQIKQWKYLTQIPPLNKQTNIFFHKLVWENAILVKLMGNITTIVRQYISGLFFVYKVNNNVLFCISLIFSKQILCFFSIFFCFDHKISKLLNNYLKSTLWVRV